MIDCPDLPVPAADLMRAAEEARQFSYMPYSHFAVGAALLSRKGRVYTGCNIESAAFSPTTCAERTALCKAVSEGERDFAALAVTGGAAARAGIFCPPCGVCRQMLSEFCPPEMPILLGSVDRWQAYTLGELLPLSFGASDVIPPHT
jgi:cytidine deaminase